MPQLQLRQPGERILSICTAPMITGLSFNESQCKNCSIVYDTRTVQNRLQAFGPQLIKTPWLKTTDLHAPIAHHNGCMHQVLSRPEHAFVDKKVRQRAAIPDPVLAVKWVT